MEHPEIENFAVEREPLNLPEGDDDEDEDDEDEEDEEEKDGDLRRNEDGSFDGGVAVDIKGKSKTSECDLVSDHYTSMYLIPTCHRKCAHHFHFFCLVN